MKLNRMSAAFSRIMLGIFLFILCFPVIFKVLNISAHKSYFIAFVLAALIFGVYLLLRKKLSPVGDFAEKLGVFKTGLILTGLCLLVNLAWVLYFRIEPTVDYKTFWDCAAELSRGEMPGNAPYIAMFPHILGYSAFLSLFLRIFGESVLVASVLNVVLSTLSGLIIYKLVLNWRDLRTAAFAYLIWCFCPSKLLYNTMVLSEPYYTCLLLAFLLLLSQLEKRGSKIGIGAYVLWALPGAVFLAGVNTARPIAMIPLIAFFIWLLLLRGEELKSKEMWKRWGAFTLVLLIVYTGLGSMWKSYAEKTLGEEIPSTPGYSIYVGFNPESLGNYSEEDMALLMDYRYNVYGNALEAQNKIMEDAKERIREGEAPLHKLIPAKLASLLGNDEGGAFYSKEFMSGTLYSASAVFSNVYYYIVVMLAVLGTLKLMKAPDRSTLQLVPLYCVGLALAQLLVEVSGRYHYSVIPMFIIMAALSCKARGEKSKGD